MVSGLVLLFACRARGQVSEFAFDASGDLLTQTSETAAPPQILAQPRNQVVIPGEAASFSVVVADTRSLSYQWQFNGAAIAGVTTDTLFLTGVTANNEGQYSVVLVNGSGTVNSAPAALMIDSRGCGMPDSWQLAHFGNLTQNATGDFDGDGVSNLQEFLDGTDPANAASVLYRIALVSDGETVVVVPAQPTYTNGQVVTLTATGSATAPFYGWTEDVDSRNSSISVVMTNNKTLFAHFAPMAFQWTNAFGGDWNGATNWTPNLAPGSNDSVVIARGIVVTLNSNVDLADFTLGIGNNAPELTGTGALTIHGAFLWGVGAMSGSGRTIIAHGATLNISNATTLSLASRTLENAGTVLWSAASPIEINGGVITNDAGATFVMQNQNSIVFGGGLPRFDNVGTFLASTNPGTTDFSSVAFNNYGTVQIQAGTLSLEGGGLNAGIITVPAGTGISFGPGAFTSGGSPAITGAGTFTVNGGTATLAGTINVTGSNVFSNGSVDFTGNYICTNTMVISGGTPNFDGTGTVSPSLLNLSSGSLGGGQTVTVRSVIIWTGGSMTGAGRTVIPPGVTLNIGSGAGLAVVNRTLDNGGTALWSGGTMGIYAGVITNEAGALFQVQNPGSFDYGGGSPRFDNAGTFRITGAGTTFFASVNFNNYSDTQIQGGILELFGGLNNGTMEVPAGAALQFAAGTFTSSAASTISGAGALIVNNGTTTLAGTVNLSGSNVFTGGTVGFTGNYICTNVMVISGAAANFNGTGAVSPLLLNLSGGSLGGSQSVTVRSVMNWSGGSMTGSGRTVIPAGVTLNIGSGAGLAVVNRTLDNGGTALWSGGTMGINAGVITNEAGALFQVQSPGSFDYGGGSPRFDNAGTFRIAGAGTTSFSFVNFNNYSDTQIQGGILELFGGLNNGTMEVPAGAALQFAAGTFTSSAASTISGAGALIVNNGTTTLGGTVNLAGSNVFTGGTVGFTGNYICTNLMVISGAAANFNGTGAVSPLLLNLSGGSLGGSEIVTVGSVMNWTGGSMTGSGRTVISAGASLNIGGNPFSPFSITGRTLDNAGTATWTGAGVISLNAAVITNRIGALFNPQNASSIIFGGGAPRFDNAGTFRKSVSTGTTALASVSFTNYGTVDIQSGILTANGGYGSTPNAVLNCALSGTIPGTNYGQLQISGSVTLNGTLSVNLTNNYIPTTNDAFTVLNAGKRTGAFANFIYPSNKVSMLLSNTTNSVIIRVSDVLAVPQPVLLPPELSGSNVIIMWAAVSNTTYRVEFNPDLNPSNWNALPGDVTAVTNVATKLDTLTPTNRFYQILVLP